MKIKLEIVTVQPYTWVIIEGKDVKQNVGDPINKILRKVLEGATVISSETLPYPATLEDAKISRCLDIDLKTGDLISEGFVFDSKTFSLSINAQINWSNIMNVPDNAFPLTIMTKDDQSYALSLANKQNFYLSALNGRLTQLGSGTSLKVQINALTTIADVETFVDPR